MQSVGELQFQGASGASRQPRPRQHNSAAAATMVVEDSGDAPRFFVFFALCRSLSLRSPPALRATPIPDVCRRCLSRAEQRLWAACQGREQTPRVASHRVESTTFSKGHALYRRRAGARRDVRGQCSAQMLAGVIQMGPLAGRHVGTRTQSSALAAFVLPHFTGSCYS